eukprot:CAMPEP_0197285142 /NCGR_PEP_ID=MMETSP0890-20130614/313_1 /TAXON_ID=44058 ORGANISM="Aureoumbra lagunensis, Strain CCMP1510" /NCGR_SAMPLE_ID=MMETSP0890 /ASSEMBLY_ACC=CAM_ASM_000533 /LENGTH=247 /DNA_ID=CAMNT_0042752355 /DNA_START=331 /DNA_END=1077 /DNA_ORIENTATION=+
MRKHVADMLLNIENPPDEEPEIDTTSLPSMPQSGLHKIPEKSFLTDERMPSIEEEEDSVAPLGASTAILAILQSRLAQLAALRQQRRSLTQARRVRLIEADLARRADADLARRERQLTSKIRAASHSATPNDDVSNANSSNHRDNMMYTHLENEYSIAPDNMTRRALRKALATIHRAQQAKAFSPPIAAELKRILITKPLSKSQVFSIELAGLEMSQLLLALRAIYLGQMTTTSSCEEVVDPTFFSQ